MQPDQNLSFTEAPLFNASAVKQIEVTAAKKYHFPLYDLMEKAGLSAWQSIEQYWPDAQTISVVCGKGNNAGDGFVVARLAASAGKLVQVFLIEPDAEFKGDALTAFNALNEQGVQCQPFDKKLLLNQDLIVDAILGTGVTGTLRKNYQQAIEAINAYSENDENNPVILSIDIPSGLHSDTGFIDPIAIQASRTISFVALKSGMVTAYARAYCGKIEIDDLGIDINAQFKATAWIDDSDALINSLPKRSKISHKGDFGHLLLIGGDHGFGGAILMSAVAAARTGVGKLTIVTRDAHIAPILTQCPEAMVLGVSGADDPTLIELLNTVDAVVIGPGLGQGEWSRDLFELVSNKQLPLLIDADALNLLAKHHKRNEHWVLTPHPGEASRLLNIDTAKIQQDRYQSIIELQEKYSGIVVLKGAGTLITNNKSTTVCIEGNAGMASAGMGDILSGIIGSLLAQGLDADLAARIGVALHARAGDFAAINGEKGLMATDLISPLRQLVNL